VFHDVNLNSRIKFKSELFLNGNRQKLRALCHARIIVATLTVRFVITKAKYT
jgi:hypothetical protein